MDEDYDLRGFANVCRLFPLPRVVLFPHAVLPLHIFEPRYRRMTEDALAGDQLVTIVQSKVRAPGHPAGDPPIEAVGCLGRILQHERLPDGRFNFLLLGRKRVRLIRELGGTPPYRRAEAEILEDEPAETPEGPRRAALIRLFRAVLESGEPLDPDFAALLDSSLPLGALTDLVAHALTLPAGIKQGLLNETRIDRRADRLHAILEGLARRAPPSNRDDRFPPPFSRN